MSAASNPIATPMRGRKWRWAGGVALSLVVATALLWWFWDWNWFRPMVETRLSAALGRPVTIDRLEVRPGRVTVLSAHGVNAANPSGFEASKSATVNRVSVTFEVETWLRSGRIVVPLIEMDQPRIEYEQDNSGKSNWDFPNSSFSGAAPEIGNVQLHDGVAHVRMAKENAETTLNISTQGEALIVQGKGTYARQPIALHATGGALLALRDAARPYPLDFQLDNGPTRITLKGHIRDPVALRGADLNLVLAGPDMALLLPLTGIATPRTPPYKVSGRLDFDNGRVKFSGVTGQVGSSDLSGDLDVNPAGKRPTLTARLMSHRVDMEDLGGFIGSTPEGPQHQANRPSRCRR